MTQVTIPKEQFEKLMALVPEMHSIEQSLKSVVNTDIMKSITAIRDTMNEVFKPYFDSEDEAFDRDSKALRQIGDDNNLSTLWSVEDVLATDLQNKMPGKVKKIFYKSWNGPQEIVFPKARTMTWLEMWIEADKLIKLSQDDHHIFVEQFNPDPKNPGVFNLFAGS